MKHNITESAFITLSLLSYIAAPIAYLLHLSGTGVVALFFGSELALYLLFMFLGMALPFFQARKSRSARHWCASRGHR